MTGLPSDVAALIRESTEAEGVTVRPGISYGDLLQLEAHLQVRLPVAFRTLLLESNGIELMYGYKRIFGYGPGAPTDITWFNDPDTWMFAYRWWRVDLEDYLFLGISADGATTACRRSDPHQRRQ